LRFPDDPFAPSNRRVTVTRLLPNDTAASAPAAVPESLPPVPAPTAQAQSDTTKVAAGLP